MYIFGYGSLMNSASRKLTGYTGNSIPAIAHGFERHWSKIDDSYVVSPLAVKQGTGQVNGVLVEVDELALQEFDRREAGYHRIQLDAHSIETLCGHHVDKTVWIYVVEQTQPPCERSPIVMSYVDTVLAGCLEVSEAFAEHFIEHTLGWQHPLIDDRLQPVYLRLAGVESHHRAQIDQLLEAKRP